MRSAWRMAEGILTLETAIPPNTTGTVYVPTDDAASVETSTGERVGDGPVYRVGSGEHVFTCSAPRVPGNGTG